MRNGLDDVWEGLALGQWLAHERRMQLLSVAAEAKLVAQMEAGVPSRIPSFGPLVDAFHGLRRLIPQAKSKTISTTR